MVRNCAAQRGDACQRCGFQPSSGTTAVVAFCAHSGATAVSTSPVLRPPGGSSASVGAAHHQDRPWGAHGPSKSQQEAAQQASSGKAAAPALEAVGAPAPHLVAPARPFGRRQASASEGATAAATTGAATAGSRFKTSPSSRLLDVDALDVPKARRSAHSGRLVDVVECSQSTSLLPPSGRRGKG